MQTHEEHYAVSRADGFGYRDCNCGERVKDGKDCPAMSPTPNSHDEAWPGLATDIGTPEFEALWKLMKSWDINVPEQYVGYSECTGSHVQAILNALKATHPAPVSAEGEREAFICTGCSSVTHNPERYIQLIQKGGGISCCPDTHYVPCRVAARTSPGPSIGEGELAQRLFEAAILTPGIPWAAVSYKSSPDANKYDKQARALIATGCIRLKEK